jgi:DNA-directed RNA polymerase specialized sigma24 family protein
MLALVSVEMRPSTLERLVDDVLAGDLAAWKTLWHALAPKLDAMLRRPGFFGRLAEHEDHRANVVLEVMARLANEDHARLRRYDEARRESPRLTLLAWLTIVLKRVAIDYMRTLPEYIDRRRDPTATSPGAWRRVGTLPSDSRLRRTAPSPSGRAAGQELLALAGTVLDDAQRPALAAWLEGASFDEIAATLACAPGDAEKRVRAAVQRLRRHLRDK